MITRTQPALYARVSSERPAEAHTVESQVAALRERIARDGLHLSDELQFIDEGYSGATLVRPVLERLRDAVAVGAVDRLYVHSPDRLARKYADQVLLVDELPHVGVEVILLNRELGQTPEDELRLQVQGMMAEYERAKILERHRRGKRHAAHAGSVNVLAAAPDGSRYIPKPHGGGQARDEIVAEEARVVCQMVEWVGHERATIGDACRRLCRAGEPTRTGKAVWDRSAVWGMLRHPAYMGTAAFGKTRQGPLRPRLRAQRGRLLQPRRATSPVEVPRAQWMMIPGPAIVAAEVLAAVQEQLRDNQRHTRPYRRGAKYLRQSLVSCRGCGYAYYGNGISHKAAQGKARDYAYYRCLGTDAYRFGGARVCRNTQVRTDLLDLAVWREVRELLAHPDRLAEVYRRRLHPHTSARHHDLTTVEGQLGKRRQGLARLIDSYAEGLIEQREVEPRITHLRQWVTKLEEQAQQLVHEAALHVELQLISGRLEDFAAQVRDGLEEADWTSRREMIHALVKRVEVDHDQVHVVFRVDQHPGDLGLEKKVCNIVGGVLSPLLANIYLQELDRYMECYTALSHWGKTKRRQQKQANFIYIRYADDFVVLCNGTRN